MELLGILISGFTAGFFLRWCYMRRFYPQRNATTAEFLKLAAQAERDALGSGPAYNREYRKALEKYGLELKPPGSIDPSGYRREAVPPKSSDGGFGMPWSANAVVGVAGIEYPVHY